MYVCINNLESSLNLNTQKPSYINMYKATNQGDDGVV